QRQAAATSLFAIVPTALVGAARYWMLGQVAWWPVLLVGAGAVAGSWAGARLLQRWPIFALTWGFIGLQVVMAAAMVLFVPVRGAEVALGLWAGAGLVVLGLVMGLCSGLFGVGGGMVAVPVLIALFGMGDLMARGVSLLVIVPTAAAGTLVNLRHGVVKLAPALVIGLSAMGASLLGVQAAAAVAPRVGSIAFALLLLVSAVQLARKTLLSGRQQHG
ncbi:MAG: sulfite exporter TauE/SafE family protein, partial [Micrococcales bacterium]|nr:sulfite exporter TauE/SafE family protein [Micrococcales bacterium]